MTAWDFFDKHTNIFHFLICIVIFFWIRFLISPLICKYWDYNLKKKEQYQRILNDMEKSLQDKSYEIEGIKIERSFNLLEDLNQLLVEMIMHYHRYLSTVLSSHGNYIDHEENRAILDKKILYIINKLAFYIPSEIYSVLYSLRRILSCSYIPADSLKDDFSDSNIDRHKAIMAASSILEKYYQCFIEMVWSYVKI